MFTGYICCDVFGYLDNRCNAVEFKTRIRELGHKIKEYHSRAKHMSMNSWQAPNIPLTTLPTKK